MSRKSAAGRVRRGQDYTACDTIADLGIGDVAQATGMSMHALRFFACEVPRLRPIPRSSGRRVYAALDVEWLRLCDRLRASACRSQ